MINFIQENFQFIFISLLLIIFALLALMIFILFKLTLKKDKPLIQNDSLPEIENKFEIKKKVEEKLFCKNHKELSSVGSCLICEEVFCEKCLIEHDGLSFCKDHFKTYISNEWEQVTDIKTTPDTPEESLYVWDFKRQLWNNEQEPSFVLTHYKINVEEDFIESYVQLNVLKNKSEELKKVLEKYKAKH